MDIGTRCVKLAQVEKAGSGFRLLSGVAVPRAQPWPEFEDPLACSLQTSRNEIHAGMLLGEDFSGRSVACVLPMSLHELRAVHIPEGNFEQRRHMIAGELVELQNPDQWQFDYWDTDRPGHTESRPAENVSVLLVPRTWADQIAKDVSSNRLTCKAIDGIPLALARAIERTSTAPCQNPVAALDWGYRSTTLSIIAGGSPLYTRTLRNCHLGRLVEAIMKNQDISVLEAEELIINGGSSDTKEQHSTVESILRAGMHDLAEELLKTLQYLRSQRPDLAPAHVWMFGGGSTIPTAPEFLTQQIGLPAKCWCGWHDQDTKPLGTACPPALLASAMSLSALPLGN